MASALGMVIRALSTVGFLAANWPASELRLSAAAMMSSVWAFVPAMNSSSWFQQTAHVVFAAGECLGDRLVDFLQLAHSAAVEQD